MEETEDLLKDELEITGTLKSNLGGTAWWATFLAVTGLTFCLLNLAASVYSGIYISRIMHERYGFSIGPAIAAIYIFFAVVLFFPCVFLYKFSVSLQHSIKINSQENLEDAFQNLRLVFKFLSIVVLIVVLFWLLSFFLLVGKNI